jgi:hypothetical protein
MAMEFGQEEANTGKSKRRQLPPPAFMWLRLWWSVIFSSKKGSRTEKNQNDYRGIFYINISI